MNLEIHRGAQRRLSAFLPLEAPPAPLPNPPAQTTPLSPLPDAPISDLTRFMGLLPSLAGSFAAALGPLLRLGGAAIPNVYQAILQESNQRTGEVSTDEMLRILSAHTATVFDGRTLLEYAIGHIPGALSCAPKPGTPMSLYVSD